MSTSAVSKRACGGHDRIYMLFFLLLQITRRKWNTRSECKQTPSSPPAGLIVVKGWVFFCRVYCACVFVYIGMMIWWPKILCSLHIKRARTVAMALNGTPAPPLPCHRHSRIRPRRRTAKTNATQLNKQNHPRNVCGGDNADLQSRFIIARGAARRWHKQIRRRRRVFTRILSDYERQPYANRRGGWWVCLKSLRQFASRSLRFHLRQYMQNIIMPMDYARDG